MDNDYIIMDIGYYRSHRCGCRCKNRSNYEHNFVFRHQVTEITIRRPAMNASVSSPRGSRESGPLSRASVKEDASSGSDRGRARGRHGLPRRARAEGAGDRGSQSVRRKKKIYIYVVVARCWCRTLRRKNYELRFVHYAPRQRRCFPR